MDDSSAPSKVRVAVRVRPMLPRESEGSCKEAVIAVASKRQVLVGSEKAFQYDHVFGPEAQQSDLYEACGKPLVDRVFQGYNATMFAYGQTGSGKTFTMGTAATRADEGGAAAAPAALSADAGVVPRVVADLFARKAELEGAASDDVSIRMSYLELHNEEIRDLLAPLTSAEVPGGLLPQDDEDYDALKENMDAKRYGGLPLREAENGRVIVADLRWVPVQSALQMGELLRAGGAVRSTKSTNMNAVSSRSHAVVSIELSVQARGAAGARVSCFSLVDLAGSERVKKTGATGATLREGISINKGLLALGNVISALTSGPAGSHVPYRDSKLTRLLQDALGGTSHTVMVACVSPSDSEMEETTNTLRYAARARNISNIALVNDVDAHGVVSAQEVAALRRKVRLLELQLLQARLAPPRAARAPQTDAEGADGVFALAAQQSRREALLLERVRALEKRSGALEAEAGALRAARAATEQRGAADAAALRLKVDRLSLAVATLREKAPPEAAAALDAALAAAGLGAGGPPAAADDVLAACHARIRRLEAEKTDLECRATAAESVAALAMDDLRGELPPAPDARARASDRAAAPRGAARDAEGAAKDPESGAAGGGGGGVGGVCSPVAGGRASDAHGPVREIAMAIGAVGAEIAEKEAAAQRAAEEAKALQKALSEALREANDGFGDAEARAAAAEREVRVLEAERDRLLQKLRSRGAQEGRRRDGERDSGREEDARRKMRELEEKLSLLRRQAAAAKRAKSLAARASSEAERLREEVAEAKARRAELQRRLSKEAAQRRADVAAEKRRAAAAARRGERLAVELKRERERAQRREAVLKRRMESAIAQQRRSRRRVLAMPKQGEAAGAVGAGVQNPNGGGFTSNSGGFGGHEEENGGAATLDLGAASELAAREVEAAVLYCSAKAQLEGALRERGRAGREAKALRRRASRASAGAEREELMAAAAVLDEESEKRSQFIQSTQLSLESLRPACYDAERRSWAEVQTLCDARGVMTVLCQLAAEAQVEKERSERDAQRREEAAVAEGRLLAEVRMSERAEEEARRRGAFVEALDRVTKVSKGEEDAKPPEGAAEESFTLEDALNMVQDDLGGGGRGAAGGEEVLALKRRLARMHAEKREGEARAAEEREQMREMRADMALLRRNVQQYREKDRKRQELRLRRARAKEASAPEWVGVGAAHADGGAGGSGSGNGTNSSSSTNGGAAGNHGTQGTHGANGTGGTGSANSGGGAAAAEEQQRRSDFKAATVAWKNRALGQPRRIANPNYDPQAAAEEEEEEPKVRYISDWEGDSTDEEEARRRRRSGGGGDSSDSEYEPEEEGARAPRKRGGRRRGSGAKEAALVPGDLSKYTVKQLKKFLQDRGLKRSGRKEELIQRLEEALGEEPGEGGAEAPGSPAPPVVAVDLTQEPKAADAENVLAQQKAAPRGGKETELENLIVDPKRFHERSFGAQITNRAAMGAQNVWNRLYNSAASKGQGAP